MSDVGFIYEIDCAVNGKGYVGQTSRTVSIRWAGHLKAARKGDKRPLYRAMRKYGIEAFTIQVLHACPVKDLNAAEKRFVRLRKTYIDIGWGYNLTTGGDHYVMSEATRRKIARKARLQFASEEARQRHAALAERRYAERPELREVIGAAGRGRVISEITKKRLSRAGKNRYKNADNRHSTSVDMQFMWAERARTSGSFKMSAEARLRMSEAAHRRFAKKGARAEASERAKAMWRNPESRTRYLAASASKSVKMKERAVEMWQRPEFRKKYKATIDARRAKKEAVHGT